MLKIRKANERGHSRFDWLDSYHSFSFSNYYDPKHMGFGNLRVVNDDIVAPGKGFGTHPHSDMEIISYVIEGALEHKDSMGNGSVIHPGDLQRMSAGTGVTHSEFNHSDTDPVRFLQIWFLPDRKGHKPGYEQKYFSEAGRRGQLMLMASATGSDGSVRLNQDLNFYAGLLHGDEQVEFQVDPARDVWVQVARGSISVNGQALQQGDGAAITEPGVLCFDHGKHAEVVIFDMARHI